MQNITEIKQPEKLPHKAQVSFIVQQRQDTLSSITSKYESEKQLLNLSGEAIIDLLIQSRQGKSPTKYLDPDSKKYSLQKLAHFNLLKDSDKAAKLIAEAFILNKKIMVIGDYDSDGATSCALAVEAIQDLGYERVSFLVPNRFSFGYGLSIDLIDSIKDNLPDLIITVDNGSSSEQAIVYAQSFGIQVIVTDHHHVNHNLHLSADAFVNPQCSNCKFPSKNIAGVGVIFYVMLALRDFLKNHFLTYIESNWKILPNFSSLHKRAVFFQKKASEINMSKFLDLVAIGTVADLVVLDENNRILVQQGMIRIRHNKALRSAIAAFIEYNKININTIQTSDLSFRIAPKINAAGRLNDISIGINCLLSKSMDSARHYVHSLNTLNTQRQSIEENMLGQAMLLAEESKRLNKTSTITIFDPNWHQGVIGIIASRIKDNFCMPTFVFTQDTSHQNISENKKIIKASGRSIEGINLRDILVEIDKQTPGAILKFGGHAMAAGLTLYEGYLNKFKDAFEKTVNEKIIDLRKENISVPIAKRTINYDFEMPEKEDFFSTDFIKELITSHPWGMGFAKPIFRNIFTIEQVKLLKDKHLKLILKLGNLKDKEAIWFNAPQNTINKIIESTNTNSHAQLDVIYDLNISDFNKIQTSQLLITYAQLK